MAFHKPRIKLVQLIGLVAVLAVELAALPESCSVGVAALSFATWLSASVSARPAQVEWAVIIAIHFILVIMLVGGTKSSRHGPRAPRPAATIAPASGKI